MSVPLGCTRTGPDADPPAEQVSEPATPSGTAEIESSPGHTELTFVSGLGMVDGLNCEEWPKDAVLDAPYSSGGEQSPSIRDQLGAAVLDYQLESLLGRVVSAARDRGITATSIYGTKYGFEIMMVEDPLRSGQMAAALDRATLIGYALSPRFACTQALANSGACTVHRVTVDGLKAATGLELEPSATSDAHFTILVRSGAITQAELDQRRLATVVAPWVAIGSGVRLDADAMIVTDRFSARGFTVEPAISANGAAQAWPTALSFVPRRGLFAVLATRLDSIDLDLVSGGGVDWLRIAGSGRSQLILPARADAIGSNGLGLGAEVAAADLLRVEASSWEWTGQRTISDVVHDGATSANNTVAINYRGISTERMDRVVNLRATQPIRKSGVDPSNAIVACEGGAACDNAVLTRNVVIYGSGPVRLDSADLRSFTSGFVQSTLQPVAGGRTACSGSFDPNPDGVYCLANTETNCNVAKRADGTAITGCISLLECHARAQAQPMRLQRCEEHTTIKVCVAAANAASGSCARKEGYSVGVHGSWSNQLAADVTSLVQNRLFGPQPFTNLLPPSSIGFGEQVTGLPILPALEVASRGAHFDLLVQGLEATDLRQGTIGDQWQPLWSRLALDLGKDPRTGIEYDLGDRARLLEAFSIRGAPLKKSSGQAVAAVANEHPATKINALGLPYGAAGGGWRQPPGASGQRTFFLDAIDDRWQTLADEILRIDGYVRFGRISGGIAGQIAADRALAEKLLIEANAQRALLEDQAASVAATAQRIDELTGDLLQLQDSFLDNMGQIWRCDARAPAGAPDSCVDQLVGNIAALTGICVQQSQNSRLGDLLNVVGMVAGWLSSFLDIAQKIISALPQATRFLEFFDVSTDLIGDFGKFLTDATDLVNKAKTAVESAKRMGDFLRKLIEGVQTAQCDVSSPAYIQVASQMSVLADMVNTIDFYALEVAELQTLVERFSHDVGYYHASAAEYERLIAALTEQLAAYDRLAKENHAENPAALIREACPLATAAIRTSLMDVYRATQSLAMTTGSAQTKPYLYVPASPSYAEPSRPASWREAPIAHGFLMSLWDSTRFRDHIFGGFGPAAGRTIVSEILARFDEQKLVEVCRADLRHLPSALYLVEKRIEGAALEAFLGTHGPSSGRLSFQIELEDLARAAQRMGSELHPGGIYDPQAKEWRELSAPIVLGAAYRVVRSGSGDSFSAPSASWAGPGLAAPAAALVPSMDQCSQPQTADALLTVDGAPLRLASCPRGVTIPEPGAESLADLGARQPEDLLDDYRFSSQPPPFCRVSQGTMVPSSLEGRPLLGLWTLTDDVGSALEVAQEATRAPSGLAPDPSWLQANQDVRRVEIYFVVGAETRAHGEPASFTLLQP